MSFAGRPQGDSAGDAGASLRDFTFALAHATGFAPHEHKFAHPAPANSKLTVTVAAIATFPARLDAYGGKFISQTSLRALHVPMGAYRLISRTN
jgi:hypothetical protein